MSRLKLPTEVTDRLRELLGGENPTPKRVETLLDELEQRRLIHDAPRAEEAEMPTTEDATAPAPAPAPSAAPPDWDVERKALYAAITAMEQKIAEIKSPHDAETTDRAIGEGKLPVPGTKAPALGMPTSPLGPKVFYKLCTCGKCTPFRLYHWFCCICRSGPHHYQQRYPHYTKNWMEPGGVRGVAHHVCSEPCRMSYLGLLGVVAGVNDHEPARVAGQESDAQAPERPVVAFDSD